jgi:4-hydroxybenzoate polyprenyltransferase
MNQKLRTLFVLARVSNLPTVWSNCLAGWWLCGGGDYWRLPLVLLGVGALYTGGMFLNDAFDVDFDRQRRPTRPIPSGAITEEWVWIYGWAWLALGIFLLIICGKMTGALAVVLAVCIVVYDASHKAITASPWLIGLCRFWVYVIAGTIGQYGFNGWPIWCGAAMAFYIVGLSYVARRESFRGPLPYWPLLFLAMPLLLAVLMNQNEARKPALVISVVLVLWILRCVRTIFFGGEIMVGRIVSGLLAGIILVDWLAVSPGCPVMLDVTFVILFAVTLFLQRFIPAT